MHIDVKHVIKITIWMLTHFILIILKPKWSCQLQPIKNVHTAIKRIFLLVTIVVTATAGDSFSLTWPKRFWGMGSFLLYLMAAAKLCQLFVERVFYPTLLKILRQFFPSILSSNSLPGYKLGPDRHWRMTHAAFNPVNAVL